MGGYSQNKQSFQLAVRLNVCNNAVYRYDEVNRKVYQEFHHQSLYFSVDELDVYSTFSHYRPGHLESDQ